MMRSVVGGPEAPLGAGCDDVSARAPRPGSAERGVAAASSESASRINASRSFFWGVRGAVPGAKLAAALAVNGYKKQGVKHTAKSNAANHTPQTIFRMCPVLG